MIYSYCVDMLSPYKAVVYGKEGEEKVVGTCVAFEMGVWEADYPGAKFYPLERNEYDWLNNGGEVDEKERSLILERSPCWCGGTVLDYHLAVLDRFTKDFRITVHLRDLLSGSDHDSDIHNYVKVTKDERAVLEEWSHPDCPDLVEDLKTRPLFSLVKVYSLEPVAS